MKYRDLEKDYIRQFRKFNLKLDEMREAQEKYEELRGPFSGKQREIIRNQIEELEETIEIERPVIENYQKELASYCNIVGGKIDEQLFIDLQQSIAELMSELNEAENSYRRILAKYNRPVPQKLTERSYERFINKLKRRTSVREIKRDLKNYNIPLTVRNIIDSQWTMEAYTGNQKDECIDALEKIKNLSVVYLYNWDLVNI